MPAATIKLISSDWRYCDVEVAAGRTRKAAGTRAGTMKFTSRILEGLVAQRGFVEPRKGIGCWVSRGGGG
jgi:hypothetical protein